MKSLLFLAAATVVAVAPAIAEVDGLVVQSGLYDVEVTQGVNSYAPDGTYVTGKKQTQSGKLCLDFPDSILQETHVSPAHCQIERRELSNIALYFSLTCKDGSGAEVSGPYVARTMLAPYQDENGEIVTRHNQMVSKAFSVSGTLTKDVNGRPESLVTESIYQHVGECPA
jgi:hypothetical protein